jgi:hypothetical protein
MFVAIFAGGILLLGVIGANISPTKERDSCRQYYDAKHNSGAYDDYYHRVPDQQRRECPRGGKPG